MVWATLWALVVDNIWKWIALVPTAIFIPWFTKKVTSYFHSRKEVKNKAMQSLLEQQKQHDEQHIAITAALDSIINTQLKQIRGSILKDCRFALRRGYTDEEELETIISQYEEYEAQIKARNMRNGIIEHTYQRFLKLEVREEADDGNIT